MTTKIWVRKDDIKISSGYYEVIYYPDSGRERDHGCKVAERSMELITKELEEFLQYYQGIFSPTSTSSEKLGRLYIAFRYVGRDERMCFSTTFMLSSKENNVFIKFKIRFIIKQLKISSKNFTYNVRLNLSGSTPKNFLYGENTAPIRAVCYSIPDLFQFIIDWTEIKMKGMRYEFSPDKVSYIEKYYEDTTSQN